MTLRGKCIDFMNKVAYVRLKDHDMELLLPVKLDIGQHVEITIEPIQTRGASVGSLAPLPLPPAI